MNKFEIYIGLVLIDTSDILYKVEFKKGFHNFWAITDHTGSPVTVSEYFIWTNFGVYSCTPS
jgi:hypothetical protein